MRILGVTVLIFLILFTDFVCAQTCVKGYVIDSQNRTIPYAIIKYKGAIQNYTNGSFQISNYNLGATIHIHKLGFADTSVVVRQNHTERDTIKLFIKLRLNPTILPEVDISSDSKREINPAKADFILSYELHGDLIMELLSDGNLLLLDPEHQVKYKTKVDKDANDILKNQYDDIYLFTDKTAYKLELSNLLVAKDSTAIDLTSVKWNLKYCDEVIDSSLFIRRYKDNNQTLAFFRVIGAQHNQAKLIKEISDQDKKEAVAIFAAEATSLNQYVSNLGINYMTASNSAEMKLVREAMLMADRLEMVYVLPSYSTIKCLNDTLYLFAHDIDSIFVFDKSLNCIKSFRINYHHLKIWDKELIFNDEKTRAYAKLRENSKTILVEINLQTGELKRNYTTIQARFPSKIKIKRNQIYFMSKHKSGIGYTLYSQNF